MLRKFHRGTSAYSGMTKLESLQGTSSMADQAKDRIRAAILEGKLRPGEKITIERIAADLGISRTPVREALKALETDNMVRLIPRRGAIVEPFAWREIEHRYAIRAMLEGYAAELACEAANEELRLALQRNCERTAKLLAGFRSSNPAKLRALFEMSHEFHQLLWTAANSPTLLRIVESLRLPSSFSESFYSTPEYRDVVMAHHSEITAALMARDRKLARELTVNHLIAAGKMIAEAARSGSRRDKQADTKSDGIVAGC